MNLHFTWINLIILFGALQGLIFTIILLFNKKHPGAKFFAAFTFAFAYNGFETCNWSIGFDQYYIFFDLFGFIVIYSLGPSFYLYVKSLLHPEKQFSHKEVLLHYGWTIIQFVLRIVIIVYHILWINKTIDSPISSGKLLSWTLFFAEELSVIIFLVYFVCTILMVKRIQSPSRIYSKETQQAASRWIRSLLIVMAFFAIAWPATVAAPHFFNIEYSNHYYPIEIFLAAFGYWLVLRGYHTMKLIHAKPQASGSKSVTDDEVTALLQKLKSSMENDKLYRDPELNLAKLSSHTSIPAKLISSILNQNLQSSFNDFVNTYRVDEVKERLIDPSNQHLTISGIALESGFNSQATFQRAFKSITGTTPRDYMNLQVKKMA